MATALGCGNTDDDVAEDSAADANTDAASAGSEESGELDSGGDEDDNSLPDDVELLPPAAQLLRASMALRGMRPSLAELERVVAQPEEFETIVDTYLEAPEFGLRVMDVENNTMLMRFEVFTAMFRPTPDMPPNTSIYALNTAMFEAPLRLVEHVVRNDLPYSEVLTADYVMANAISVAAWADTKEGWQADGPTWQPVRYTDKSTPKAGILSDVAVYFRHRSGGINEMRSRANRFALAFLCSDFLDRDIVVDEAIDLTDPDEVNHAVQTSEKCLGCHMALDPMAGYFWGFAGQFVQPQLPIDVWDESRTDRRQRPAGLSGRYGPNPWEDDVSVLGQLMVEDPRFVSCTARRYYAHFAHLDIDEVPVSVVNRLVTTFKASGLSIKALARAIVTDPKFMVSHADTDASAEDLRGYKLARIEMLDTMFADLTGFRWQWDHSRFGRVDLATSAQAGYRTLAGSIDSWYVTQPWKTVNMTTSLVLRALSWEAANYVVHHDFESPTTAKLLTEVGPGERDETKIRGQLTLLHRRLYGEFFESNAQELNESWALFSTALADTNDPKLAWVVTLTAMMQDLKIVYY